MKSEPKNRSRRLLALSLLLVGAGALASPGVARAAEHADEWITAMIKMEMWTAGGVPSTDVSVDTADGRVVLSGKVETAAEREAAEKVARTVDGVKDVRNLLQLVPAKQEKAVDRADKEIEANVKRAFSSERALKGSKVAVSSVSKGVVLLTGEARTFSEQLYAVETARVVKGVRQVVTQIKGPRVLSDDEIAEGRESHAGRDMYITTAVKLRLLADRAVSSFGINVDTRYGMVTLFGTVPTESAKTAAGRDARKVSGVDRVLNDLQVVPAAERKLVAAKDDVVSDSVKKSFEGKDEMKKVDVNVKNAVVRLTGSVHSVPAKLRASVLASGSPGVDSVQNDLQIKR